MGKFDYLLSHYTFSFIFPLPIYLPDITTFYNIIGPEKTKDCYEFFRPRNQNGLLKTYEILEKYTNFFLEDFQKKLGLNKYYLLLHHASSNFIPPIEKKPGRFYPWAWVKEGWFRGVELLDRQRGGSSVRHSIDKDKDKTPVPLSNQVEILKWIIKTIPTRYIEKENKKEISKLPTYAAQNSWGPKVNMQTFMSIQERSTYMALDKKDFICFYLAKKFGFKYAGQNIPGLLEET